VRQEWIDMTYLDLLILSAWLKVLRRRLKDEYICGLDRVRLLVDVALADDAMRWRFVVRMSALAEELEGMK
jgi:hypothetical protein